MADNVVQLPFGKPKGLPEVPLLPVMSFTGKDGGEYTLEISESEYEWYGLVLIKLAKFRGAIRWFVVSNPQIMNLNARRILEMRVPRAHFEAFTASFDFTFVLSAGGTFSDDDFLRLSEMDHCTLMDETALEKLTLPFAVYLLPTNSPDNFELVFAEL